MSRVGGRWCCNLVYPNDYVPFMWRDVSTFLFLGLNVFIEVVMGCLDLFGQLSPPLLNGFADLVGVAVTVAGVGLVVFSALGSVMNIVVGVLSIIQGAKELGKDHNVNGSRLLVEGALTMIIGSFLSESFLVLRKAYLLKQAHSFATEFFLLPFLLGDLPPAPVTCAQRHVFLHFP